LRILVTGAPQTVLQEENTWCAGPNQFDRQQLSQPSMLCMGGARSRPGSARTSWRSKRPAINKG